MRRLIWGFGGLVPFGGLVFAIGMGLPSVMAIPQAEGGYAMGVAFFRTPLGAVPGALIGALMGKPKRQVSVVVVGAGAVDHKTLVAIAAFDPAGVSRDRQPDPRMAKRTLAAVATDLPGSDGLDFGDIDGHGLILTCLSAI